MNCKVCQLKPSTMRALSTDNQQAINYFLQAKSIYQNNIEHISEAEKKAFLSAYADANGLITMPNGDKVKMDFILEFDQKIADHLELVEPNAAKDWEGYTGEPEPVKKTKAQVLSIIKGYEVKLKRTKTAEQKNGN